MSEKNCVGVTYITECPYAVIGNGYIGCSFDKRCEYQRPLLPSAIGSVDIERIVKESVKKYYNDNKHGKTIP